MTEGRPIRPTPKIKNADHHIPQSRCKRDQPKPLAPVESGRPSPAAGMSAFNHALAVACVDGNLARLGLLRYRHFE